MDKIIWFFTLIFSVACSATELEKGSELVTRLDEVNKLLGEVIEGSFEQNQDGVKDIFYEYLEDGSYFELSDSNYDGKTDLSCKFDKNDTLSKCTQDQYFNGLFETEVRYNFGVAVKEGVDLNAYSFFEIVLYYKSGILTQGYKYYINKDGKRMISNVKYRFGYPYGEKVLETNLSEIEFSNLYWANIVD